MTNVIVHHWDASFSSYFFYVGKTFGPITLPNQCMIICGSMLPIRGWIFWGRLTGILDPMEYEKYWTKSCQIQLEIFFVSFLGYTTSEL